MAMSGTISRVEGFNRRITHISDVARTRLFLTAATALLPLYMRHHEQPTRTPDEITAAFMVAERFVQTQERQGITRIVDDLLRIVPEEPTMSASHAQCVIGLLELALYPAATARRTRTRRSDIYYALEPVLQDVTFELYRVTDVGNADPETETQEAAVAAHPRWVAAVSWAEDSIARLSEDPLASLADANPLLPRP